MTQLSPAMQRALTQYQATGTLDGVRAQTAAALARRGLVPVQESYALPRPVRFEVRYNADLWVPRTHDVGQADYRFWDKAHAGKAQGLELSGLFLNPLASKKAAWVLGLLPKVRFERQRTQERVTQWLSRQYASILRAFEEAARKGDCYLVVNPPDPQDPNLDMTLTVVPPHVVAPIVDEADYSRTIGWQITEMHPHPVRAADSMKIIDRYTLDTRERIIQKNGVTIKTQRWRNLLGRIPVVHIPNNRGADELFGHPEGEALLPLLQAYGEIFAHAISGNKRQGRPTPVIEKMGTVDQIEAFWQRFGKTEKRTLPDGTVETVTYIPFDSDKLLTLGAEAQFSYQAPGSFSSDTEVLLGLLFYLLLQHTEFPEFIWGNAIASSKASAEAQLPPFVKWVEKQQAQCLHWFADLLRIAVAYFSLFERGVNAQDEPTVLWQPLTGKDGTLTLQAVQFAYGAGLLDDETALLLLPLEVENPREVLDKARAEAAERQDAFERDMQTALADDPQDDEDEDAAQEDAAAQEFSLNGHAERVLA